MRNLDKANVAERDTIIFGGYNPDHYSGGIRSFEGLDAEELKTLVQKNFLDEADCQNNSPYARDIISFLEDYPMFTAHGYAVSADRYDYRVTIEGVAMSGEYSKDTLLAFVKMFRDADELTLHETYLSAWYD